MRRVLPALAGGLALGGWVALVAGLLTLVGGGATAALVGVAAAFGIPLVAAAAMLLRRASWRQAARAVDRHFHLHDRTVTALHLAEGASSDPFAAMQLDDALSRLRGVQPRSAVSLRVPWQRLCGGLLLTAFGAVLIGWGLFAPPLSSVTTTSPSGDRQGEALPQRELLDAKPVDKQLAQRSAALAEQSGRLQRSTAQPLAEGGLSDRYFDALRASAAP